MKEIDKIAELCEIAKRKIQTLDARVAKLQLQLNSLIQELNKANEAIKSFDHSFPNRRAKISQEFPIVSKTAVELDDLRLQVAALAGEKEKLLQVVSSLDAEKQKSEAQLVELAKEKRQLSITLFKREHLFADLRDQERKATELRAELIQEEIIR